MPNKKHPGRLGVVWMVLIVLLALLSLAAIAVGSAGYSLGEILRALTAPEASTVKVVVYSLRLPRLLLAVLMGSRSRRPARFCSR